MSTAVLFDLFGTLLWLERNAAPIDHLVGDLTEEESSRVRHRLLTKPLSGLDELDRELGTSLAPATLQSLTDELARDVESARRYPDTEETLLWLRTHGIATVVVSNLASPYKRCYALCGLDRLVDHVVFSCDVGVAKPDARIFEHARRVLDADPQNCIMVGDSHRADYEGARSAGMTGLHLVRSASSDIAAGRISSLLEVQRWIAGTTGAPG